jgi:hypothetical protein
MRHQGRRVPPLARNLLAGFLVLLFLLCARAFPSVKDEGLTPILSLVFGLFCVGAALISTLRSR